MGLSPYWEGVVVGVLFLALLIAVGNAVMLLILDTYLKRRDK